MLANIDVWRTSDREAVFSEITLVSALKYITFVYTPGNQKKFTVSCIGMGVLQFLRVLGEYGTV